MLCFKQCVITKEVMSLENVSSYFGQLQICLGLRMVQAVMLVEFAGSTLAEGVCLF